MPLASRRGWGARKPPLGAQIDWGHPLARGLEVAILGNEWGGGTPREGRRQLPGVFTNSPTWLAPGIDFASGGTGYVDWVMPDDGPFTQQTGITLLWRGVIRTGSNYRHFLGKHAGNGSADNPFDFRTDNSATPQIVLVRANGGFRAYTGPTTVTLNGVHTYAAVCADATIENAPTFYADGIGTTGVPDGSFPGAGSGLVSGTGSDLLMGRRADGAVQMDGTVECAYIWSRALSGGDIVRLTIEPYIFIRPAAPYRRYVRAAAAVATRGHGLLFGGLRNRHVQVA